MRKLLSVIASAVLITLACSTASASVIFDFVQTGVSGNCLGPNRDICGPITPVAPVPILVMTLSNETETGSATYGGLGSPPPVITDPNFQLAEPNGFGGASISASGSAGFCCGGLFYSISWDAEQGNLASVNIAYVAEDDEAFLGLTGGRIGSDGAFGPYCGNEICAVTGYWTPEPSSASLLLCALVILCVATRVLRARNRKLSLQAQHFSHNMTLPTGHLLRNGDYRAGPL